MISFQPVPIVLFTYARPDHLVRTLACLHENQVPLIWAFSDGARIPEKVPLVKQVRDILHSIDWCEITISERQKNWGLGRSILNGVTEVLMKYEMCIVYEDDLICVPGTYQFLSKALNHYKDDFHVMSVTGWTHPAIIPDDVINLPYFDGRAECLVWGTWARAWNGMERDAKSLMLECEARGIDRNKYGSDLPAMAKVELRRNLWAVRWLYHHMLKNGLSLRPPWSMVEHIGFDIQATNTKDGDKLANPPLNPCPPIPSEWPESEENIQCPELARRFFDINPSTLTPPFFPRRIWNGFRQIISDSVGNPSIRNMSRNEFFKLFIPPLAVGYLRRILNRDVNGRTNLQLIQRKLEWEYIPEGWLYTKTHPEVLGWDVLDILEIYKQKWPRFIEVIRGTEALGVAHESNLATNEDIISHNTIMAFAYSLSLAAKNKNKISILDWGGGIGHYFLLAQALLPEVHIDYHCKDMPILVDHGAKLFPDQHFYSDESCLKKLYDFVIASASLHYSEDWKLVLAGLVKATDRFLYISRLPTVLRVSSFVFIQRPYAYNYNTEYLGWCLNKDIFLEEARKLGVTLVREFIIGEQPLITNAPEPCQYRGFLFRSHSNKDLVL